MLPAVALLKAEHIDAVLLNLAEVLDYPQVYTAQRAAELCKKVNGADPASHALTQALTHFAEFCDKHFENGELAEHYTQLFDLKPVCTLHCSYHLLGDTYERGALLAMLAGEMKSHHIAFTHDLPDYLPTLLRLAQKLDPGEERALLVFPIIVAGLTHICAALQKIESPYRELLVATQSWLEAFVPRCDVNVQLKHPQRPSHLPIVQ